MSSSEELSPQLRAQLSPLLAAELKRMNGEDADASLLDYLLLLVNSGRPQAAVTADLVEFFGEQHAEALGAFLAKLYKDYVVPQQQQSKKISLKRTREDSAPKSPAIAPAAAPSTTSSSAASSSSSRKPDQARFAAGAKVGKTQPAAPAAPQRNELIVGGGRVQSRRGLSSAIVVHRKQDDDSAQGEVAAPELDVTRPAKARRSGHHDAASESSNAAATSETKFQITFHAANGGRTAAPATQQAGAAKPKRLLITKNGQAVHSSPSSTPAQDIEQTNAKITRRGKAAAEVLQTVRPSAAATAAQKAATARRSFGGGFVANEEQQEQQEAEPEQQEEEEQPQQALPVKLVRVQRTVKPAAAAAAAPAAAPAKAPPRVVQKRTALLPTPAPAAQQQQEDDMADEPSYDNGHQQSQPLLQQPSAFAGGYSAFSNQAQQQSAFSNQAQQQSAFTQQLQQQQSPFASSSAHANPNAGNTKCRFFPRCTNLACPFLHPTQLCPYFPNCKAGESCPNLHPAVPCRFGEKCTNPVCSYSHPPGFVSGASSSVRGRGGASVRGRGGRGGGASTRAGISAFPEGIIPHKSGFDVPGARGGGSAARGRGGLTNALAKMNTPCRFGAACTRDDCHFSHPGGAKQTSDVGTSNLDISAPFSAFSAPHAGGAPRSATEIAAQIMQRQQQQ